MSQIQIGWAKREFSMNVPCNINGQMYLRVCEGIHDPLYATALCVEGEDLAIFVSVDVTVLRGGIIEKTVAFVQETHPEIKAEHIVMNATHTHSSMAITETAQKAPDGRDIYSGTETCIHIARKAAEAVCEAYENRKPGGMAYGYGYAVVAHSRRVVYSTDQGAKNPFTAAPNGFGVMYGSTKKPDFESYEAGADHFLNAMFTYDDNDKLTGMIVNIPCPSQLSEHFTKLSADYWCEVRQAVAKEFGEDVFVLPQCAAAGDLSPRVLHYKEAQARRFALKYDLHYDVQNVRANNADEYAKVMGERFDIAERVIEGLKDIYSWAKKDIQKDVPVRHIAKTLQIHKRTVTKEEADRAITNIEIIRAGMPKEGELPPDEYSKKVTSYKSYIGRNQRALDRYNEEAPDQTMETVIHTVQVGDIAFATNRFELYMDFMHQIQARSPFIQTFVVQLAGAEGGSYLATNRGVANRGYSASIFCNQASPLGGHEIVENTLEMLNEMKEKDQ